MVTDRDILARARIVLRFGGRRGQNYATCPQCSHERRHKKRRCLSVLIDETGVRWNCHHCGWHGGEFYDAYRTVRGGISARAIDLSRNRRKIQDLYR